LSPTAISTSRRPPRVNRATLGALKIDTTAPLRWAWPRPVPLAPPPLGTSPRAVIGLLCLLGGCRLQAKDSSPYAPRPNSPRSLPACPAGAGPRVASQIFAFAQGRPSCGPLHQDHAELTLTLVRPVGPPVTMEVRDCRQKNRGSRQLFRTAICPWQSRPVLPPPPAAARLSQGPPRWPPAIVTRFFIDAPTLSRSDAGFHRAHRVPQSGRAECGHCGPPAAGTLAGDRLDFPRAAEISAPRR